MIVKGGMYAVQQRHPPSPPQHLAVPELRARGAGISGVAAAGLAARRRNKRYVSVQRRLQRLQHHYARGSIMAIEYISGVSYNLAERH